ncbi:DUF47 domain-containing protein [Salidesulfovibrio onnuriiensis]|uniref:DUF47 domain-containing protein n=1 Tax=Salidesulfovibrio onnuriiensis TaxID=2583823 RepID=UPI0011C795E2|nr:DUF47 family protein [Salidesulfovibrio onnuriiensis]
MGINILRSSIKIEKQIDDFLSLVSEAALTFREGLKAYLTHNRSNLDNKLAAITEKEHRGDTLCRNIEMQLYTKTIIPDSRGDVLELLENMDYLLGGFKGVLWRFDIETPEIPNEFHTDFIELSEAVVETAEAIVCSARSFFKDTSSISNHMHKVSYWETECDKIVTRLQRSIFNREDLRLSHKMQLCDLARSVDKIANKAEDVADKLAIYVIKRSL